MMKSDKEFDDPADKNLNRTITDVTQQTGVPHED